MVKSLVSGTFSSRFVGRGLFPATALALFGLNLETHAVVPLQPQVVKTRFPTSDVVVAVEILSPTSDGKDASGRLAKAIDRVAAAGGGVVFLEAGHYRLAAAVTVKEGVTLRGDWAPPTADGWENGTVLELVSGRGRADGPAALSLERGSGLRELVLWHPDQRATEIVPYPWAVRSSQRVSGDNTTVLNVTLVNPYQGLRIGPEWNELHTIRNVFGTPLKTGLWLDGTTDIGRITDVDFRAGWWESSELPGAPTAGPARRALRRFLASQGTGAVVGRSDWEYLYRFRAAGYAVGLRFQRGKRGDSNAVMFGCELRNCGTAMVLDSVNAVGLAATACVFDGAEFALLGPASFTKTAQFNSCEFRTVGGENAVRLDGRGLLTFQNCTFTGWKRAAIDARAGGLSVLGCEFRQAGEHVRLGEALEKARILGNRFAGAPGIVDRTRNADVAIASSVPLRFARPDVSPHRAAPARRPASDRLFSVADFGADASAPDNTAAFASALAAARRARGGTVYVPAGYYRLRGGLTVPSGVELRGCFDVPHHTISGGSVLMPLGGRGETDGPPFLQLEAGSGLRGLTVWYPEQNLLDVTPYPWTVRSLGPNCWVQDVTLGNAYQGVDFGTYPSAGHVVSYLAGAVLRKGLWVSKSDGDGWIEDVQFNPHYSVRLPGDLPRPVYGKRDVGGAVIDTQRHHLEGIVFGRCRNEYVRGTFLYAAWDGIAFRDDGGGTNARIIQHGTDTGSRALFLEKVGERGVEFIDAQLVALGRYVRAAIVTAPEFSGKVALFNSQIWAGPQTGIFRGPGEVLLQQLGTRSGPIRVEAGRFMLENANFSERMEHQVEVLKGCESARLLANFSARGPFSLRNRAGARCWARANGASRRPTAQGPARFGTGWEPGESAGLKDTVAVSGGGTRAVRQATCGPVRTPDAHSGGFALRLRGEAVAGYAFVYFRVFDGPLAVHGDSVLSYWLRPENELGRHVGVDLLSADGRLLRDSGARTSAGAGVHPSSGRGKVGVWQRIEIPLGHQFGEGEIAAVMFAFDSRKGPGPFSALIDDFRIESAEGAVPWQLTMVPSGGSAPVGTRVELKPGPEVRGVRYTLDGTNPTKRSARYTAPVVLDKLGLWEVRAVAESAKGVLSKRVFSALFEVRAPAP
ncbi:MAG: hypothetical protein GXP31_04695 [Kiritimatiellaeota bacterium]|nr:hypothetical protein [Kiritimatiellota bacterium]